MIQENCYVVSDDVTKECVIVDCGVFYPEERAAIVQYINNEQLKVKHLLSTHGHFDHNCGNDTIFNEFGILPEVHAKDEYLMAKLAEQAEAFAGVKLENDVPQVGKHLKDGDIITFGNYKIKVIETPGHTPGSVFLYVEDEHFAFSGDTLFKGDIGRTDLEGGSVLQIIQSLRHICQLPDDTVVLPGHGEQTTIGYEVAHNPYLDR